MKWGGQFFAFDIVYLLLCQMREASPLDVYLKNQGMAIIKGDFRCNIFMPALNWTAFHSNFKNIYTPVLFRI